MLNTVENKWRKKTTSSSKVNETSVASTSTERHTVDGKGVGGAHDPSCAGTLEGIGMFDWISKR